MLLWDDDMGTPEQGRRYTADERRRLEKNMKMLERWNFIADEHQGLISVHIRGGNDSMAKFHQTQSDYYQNKVDTLAARMLLEGHEVPVEYWPDGEWLAAVDAELERVAACRSLRAANDLADRLGTSCGAIMRIVKRYKLKAA